MITAITGLILLSVDGVTAGCYNGGELWASQPQAIAWVSDACTKNGGMFTGWYAPGQAKRMCLKDIGNRNCFFEVQNLNTATGFDLADSDCVMRLSNEINGCNHGGESTVAGWRFR
jgi:hypothetical protein